MLLSTGHVVQEVSVRLSWQVVEESHEEWVQGVAMWQGASLYSLRWVTSSVSLVGVVCVCDVVCVLCADSGRLVRTG